MNIEDNATIQSGGGEHDITQPMVQPEQIQCPANPALQEEANSHGLFIVGEDSDTDEATDDEDEEMG